MIGQLRFPLELAIRGIIREDEEKRAREEKEEAEDSADSAE